MGKHFIDGQDKIVEDAIEGLLCHSSNLARLDGFEQGIRVVVYKDWDRERDGKSQVALISGGGIAFHFAAFASCIVLTRRSS
jgi:hypothetical protein